jgi:ATP-dependent protease ClpP protease subunit
MEYDASLKWCIYFYLCDCINVYLIQIVHVQYRERIIFIGDSIDEEFSNQVLASMLYLDSVDNTKKILLYINGPGGDVRT